MKMLWLIGVVSAVIMVAMPFIARALQRRRKPSED